MKFEKRVHEERKGEKEEREKEMRKSEYIGSVWAWQFSHNTAFGMHLAWEMLTNVHSKKENKKIDCLSFCYKEYNFWIYCKFMCC